MDNNMQKTILDYISITKLDETFSNSRVQYFPGRNVTASTETKKNKDYECGKNKYHSVKYLYGDKKFVCSTCGKDISPEYVLAADRLDQLYKNKAKEILKK